MRTHLITCAVMQHECEALRHPELSFTFLPQGLHQTPQKLGRRLQQTLEQLRGQGFDRIVVGYGFCGKGLVGARAAEQPLVIPMVPDCIALLLGSAERYRELRAQEPGTYFLTRGWVEHGGGPLDKAAAYRAALGRAGAASAVRRELRHYKRLLWIETNVDPDGRFQARAREQARSLGLSFEAVTGDPGLLAEMLRGGGDGRFRVIPPGASVGADMYLDL